jgi:hypothetical protein
MNHTKPIPKGNNVYHHASAIVLDEFNTELIMPTDKNKNGVNIGLFKYFSI